MVLYNDLEVTFIKIPKFIHREMSLINVSLVSLYFKLVIAIFSAVFMVYVLGRVILRHSLAFPRLI